MPTPDWVSSYTVHNAPAHSIRENLSRETLQHLAQHGLESDASGTLASGKKARSPDRDCICFPWLVVQHGKANGTAAHCHLEAANTATAAVMILEGLCKLVPAGIQGKANEHVPFVVGITTVQKMVRVWITYSSRPSFEDVAKFVSAPFLSKTRPCDVWLNLAENGVHLGRRHDGNSRPYEVLGHPLQRPQVGIA